MAAAGVWPKTAGDIVYSSDLNELFYSNISSIAGRLLKSNGLSDTTISANTTYTTGFYAADLFTVDATKTLTIDARAVIIANKIDINGDISANTKGTSITYATIAGNAGGGTASVAGSSGAEGETCAGGVGYTAGTAAGKSANYGNRAASRIAQCVGGQWNGINSTIFNYNGHSGYLEGAKGGSGQAAPNAGGNGGGGIILIADEVDIGAGCTVSADGGVGASGTAGGGAGGSGGIILVIANKTTGTGTLSVDAGNGGAGQINTGGGAGGNGGYILTFGEDASTPFTTSVTAGTGGTSSGTGTAGSNGNAGVATYYQV